VRDHDPIDRNEVIARIAIGRIAPLLGVALATALVVAATPRDAIAQTAVAPPKGDEKQRTEGGDGDASGDARRPHLTPLIVMTGVIVDDCRPGPNSGSRS